MLMLRQLFFAMLCLPAASLQAQVETRSYWNPGTGQRLTEEDLRQVLDRTHTLVLGEEHYNTAVQLAEADIIRFMNHSQTNSKSALIFGWEFLNTEDAPRIKESYGSFLQDQIKAEEFLMTLFPNSPAPIEYAPVMEASRDVQAALIPTNLSRAQKNPVTRGGIEALDPALLPADFQMGGPHYLERFREAMGDHPLPYPVENYFASQSLTDEVMATELLIGNSDDRRVLIVGSFHGDYRDGVVASLERRRPGTAVLYIRILDASSYEENELKDLFVHPKYGKIADLLVIVNKAH